MSILTEQKLYPKEFCEPFQKPNWLATPLPPYVTEMHLLFSKFNSINFNLPTNLILLKPKKKTKNYSAACDASDMYNVWGNTLS